MKKDGLFSEPVFVGLIAAACAGLLAFFPAVALLLRFMANPVDSALPEHALGTLPVMLAPFILFFMVLSFWKKFVGVKTPTTRELIATAVSAIIVSVIIYMILQITADYFASALSTPHPHLESAGNSGHDKDAVGAFGITAAAAICFFGMPNAALIAAMYGWFWREKLIRKGIIKPGKAA